jgi:hypothetical protein
MSLCRDMGVTKPTLAIPTGAITRSVISEVEGSAVSPQARVTTKAGRVPSSTR